MLPVSAAGDMLIGSSAGDEVDYYNGDDGKSAMFVGHRQVCRRHELDETRCLNGGRCFTVVFHNSLRRSGCR